MITYALDGQKYRTTKPVPVGYTFRWHGAVRKGDLVWAHHRNAWIEPGNPGWPVRCYPVVLKPDNGLKHTKAQTAASRRNYIKRQIMCVQALTGRLLSTYSRDELGDQFDAVTSLNTAAIAAANTYE